MFQKQTLYLMVPSTKRMKTMFCTSNHEYQAHYEITGDHLRKILCFLSPYYKPRQERKAIYRAYMSKEQIQRYYHLGDMVQKLHSWTRQTSIRRMLELAWAFIIPWTDQVIYKIIEDPEVIASGYNYCIKTCHQSKEKLRRYLGQNEH